jgi:branched-subunit amino acid aminotransferase/4-amino-4-deoxychorismate lyase
VQTSSAPALQLFAVHGSLAQALPIPGGATTIHDAIDGFALGVYSALRTFHHDRFLWLEAHLDRTDRSMELLGWSYRLDRPALRRALHQVVTSYPLVDSRVRFDVLAEPTQARGKPSRILITLSPFKPVPEPYIRDGVRVEIARDLRREKPLIKTADFVLRRRPFPLERQEAYEHLLVNAEGRILECSSSNFHGVRATSSGGELVSGGGGALEGITQKIVLHLAEKLGTPVRRENVRIDELSTLDEAFLTSSTRGLVPIVSVAGSSIGTGAPGPLTAQLRAAYEAFAEREAVPAI